MISDTQHFPGLERKMPEQMIAQFCPSTEKAVCPSSPAYRRDATIFLLDDIRTNLMVLQALLKLFGVKTEVCDSPTEALKRLKARKFDLLIIDLWMPEMNGDTFARQARRIHGYRDVPFIALTADVECRNTFDLFTFHQIMFKPVSRMGLLDLLSTYLPAAKSR